MLCLHDMRAHDWVPLKSYFKGSFNVYEICGSHRIYIKAINSIVPFIEGNATCQYNTTIKYEVRGACAVALYDMSYTIEDNSPEGIHFTLDPEKELYKKGDKVYFDYTIDDNYKMNSFMISDAVKHSELYISTEYDTKRTYFSMPDNKASIDVDYVKQGEKKLCKSISGSGKDIGDEVACGTEHFYIIDINENEIKLLAKYNLLTGYIIHKQKIEKDDNSISDSTWCSNYASSKGGTVKTGMHYDVPGYCFYEVPIQNDNVRQDSSAISAHWDNDDNYSYPQIGDYYIHVYNDGINSKNPLNNTDFSYSTYTDNNYDNNFVDISISGRFGNIVRDYKNLLFIEGYSIKDANILSLDEINNLVKMGNNILPYEIWKNGYGTIITPHHEFGTLIGLLPEKYSFIYNTTYWLRTGFISNNTFDPSTSYNPSALLDNLLFVDSAGGVCSSGLMIDIQSGYCMYTETVNSMLGAGIRPVLIIPNELEYSIIVEDDSDIEIVDSAEANETITFKLNTKSGKKFKSIIVRTTSGEEIELTDEDIIANPDGTLTVNNKFIMPNENVSLLVNYENENPDTNGNILIFIAILFFSTNGLLLMYDNKDKIKYLFRYN